MSKIRPGVESSAGLRDGGWGVERECWVSALICFHQWCPPPPPPPTHTHMQKLLTSEETQWQQWSDILKNWEDFFPKNTKLVKHLARQGIPEHLRGMAWQLLSGSLDPELKEKYPTLINVSGWGGGRGRGKRKGEGRRERGRRGGREGGRGEGRRSGASPGTYI